MVKYVLLLASLVLAGCTGSNVTKEKMEAQVEAPEIVTHKRFNELYNMAPPDGPLIPIAVYKFADMTGQRKPSNSFASDLSLYHLCFTIHIIHTRRCAGCFHHVLLCSKEGQFGRS